MFTSYTIALFSHLLGVVVFVSGIVLAGAPFEIARRRENPQQHLGEVCAPKRLREESSDLGLTPSPRALANVSYTGHGSRVEGKFLKRSLLALSAAALLAISLPAVGNATHKPGHQPGAGGVDLTISARPTTIVFGGATVISGRLKGPKNANKRVTLRADGYPFTGDTSVASASTTSNGSYSFTQRPDRNTNYQVTSGAVRTERVRVNVRFRVSFAASDYTPRAGQLVRFRGRACPESDGAVVSIQRKTSTGRFHTVRRTTLKAAATCSTYSRRLRVRRDGTYRVTTDDAARARGYSRARFLNAH